MSVVFVWILMFFTTGQRGTVTVAFPSSQHQPTNNNNIHAMIVSSSRYWFNYRHAMNPLDVYQLLRNNGIPDDNIILMIADEYASNPRNPYKIRMHAMRIFQESWYDHQTEIDYRGADVTIQNVINALLGQAPKSLHSNADSNVLIYLTGHGGDQVSTVRYSTVHIGILYSISHRMYVCFVVTIYTRSHTPSFSNFKMKKN
jgi:glycosylphosphatidylinositol transamidase (GPIT) subunit GPI8